MTRLDGIDGSHYQFDGAPPDFATVRAIPTWWLAWKATQSTTYVDPTFATSRAQAAPAGFTHFGAYHWLSSTRDPAAQAAHHLATIGTLHRGEFVMLDAEEAGITADGCLVFCEAVEKVTRRPVVVYSGLYVAGGTIWRSIPLRASQYGPRPFIVAAYVSEANLKARIIATGSTNFPYDGWQYSSNGPVAGIIGRCDMDRIDNRSAFDLAAGTATNPQPVPEDDVIDIVRDAETNNDKFAVMTDGTLRPLSGTELKARGIANSVELGAPLTKAERDELGYYTPGGDFGGPIALSVSLTGAATGKLG